LTKSATLGTYEPNMKKIIVTGHLGFIASAFCEMYREKYEITGIDFAGWGSMEQNLFPGVEDIRADISDAARVREIVDKVKPDAIVNFAAESHVDRSNEDDTSFWQSNVFGARNLAIEASRLGIRMAHVSTDEVYGDAAAADSAWTETSPISPKNPYAVTKASAEMLLQVYAESKKTNLDLVITRGANTIGPRQFPEKAVPKAVWCFTNDKPFPLFKTPARRMWLHVNDHVTGIEAALRKGKTGEIYNIAPAADSEEITEVVIDRIRALVGKGDIEKIEDRDCYDLRYWMSAEKAEKELGWKAEHDLTDTINSTTDWYLENPEWLTAGYKAATQQT
jgi:dTDP-glucose 4,6-dehydratase